MGADSTATVRRRLSREDRREQLLSVAREVFSELGVRGTRMRDVAQRAGITEPYLYRHFSSRDELYEQAVLGPLDRLARNVVAETHELMGRSDISRVEILRRFHIVCLQHFGELAPLLRAQVLPRDPSQPWFHSDVLFPRWRDVVAAVISDVTGWEIASLNLEVMVHALMGLYLEMAFESDLEQRPMDVEHIAGQLTVMFAAGHSTAGPKRKGGTSRHQPRASKHVAAAGPASTLVLSDGTGGPSGVSRSRLTRAERRASILSAAQALFLEVGLSGARSKDIADRAGITETFLYRHFSSKDEIYEEAVERPLEGALAALAADIVALAESSDGVDFVEALNVRCLEFFRDHGGVLGAALLSDVERSRRFYREITAYLRTITGALAPRLGYDPAQVDPELARRAVMGCQWGVSMAVEGFHRPLAVVEAAEHLTRLFTTGVRPVTPRRPAAASANGSAKKHR